MFSNKQILAILKVALIVLMASSTCIAQNQLHVDSMNTMVAKWTQLPGKATQEAMYKLNHVYTKIDQQLDKQTARYLDRLQRQEQKLRKKLQGIDSNKTRELFFNSTQYYQGLENKFKNAGKKLGGLNQYIPGLDSIATATKFLTKAGSLPGLGDKQFQLLRSLNGSAGELQSKIQATGNIKDLLRQREQMLKQQLAAFSLDKYLKNINKQVYYYQQQLGEYKAMLQDEKKLEEKAMGLVREIPAFKDFMSKNSLLAQLFPKPNNYADPALALSGLQTRSGIQQQLTQQLSSAGSGNPQQYLQQQIQQAQNELSQLKNKVNQLGGGSSDLFISDFKPNSQRTKSLWKRLEYGMNIQSQKTNSLLPVTSDIALTAGYKLNDKSIIGIGMGYKIGWGKNISNIKLTGEGVSLRSYLDVKLKGSIWITGGYEENYQQSFSKIEQLKDLNAWQKSGLIGLYKKYRIGKKKGNLQLLWDFLSYSQIPRTQPLKLRVGYVF